MIEISENKFIFAAQANLVANTPLFLLKKLQQDESVLAFSQKHSAEEILAELEKVYQDPDLSINSVLPHILLVALSMNDDRTYLKRASNLGNRKFRWYREIANLLIKDQITKIDSTINFPIINIQNNNINNNSSLINLEILT